MFLILQRLTIDTQKMLQAYIELDTPDGELKILLSTEREDDVLLLDFAAKHAKIAFMNYMTLKTEKDIEQEIISELEDNGTIEEEIDKYNDYKDGNATVIYEYNGFAWGVIYNSDGTKKLEDN